MGHDKIIRFARWAQANDYPVCVELDGSKWDWVGRVVEVNSVVLTIDTRPDLRFANIERIRWIGLDPEFKPCLAP